jgi:type 1 fimbriae regulatory protein FimB
MQSLTRPQLLDLLRCAKKHSTRDWLMILVAYWHGLRATEVIAMQPDAVADGFLTVQRLKGSLRTTQPLVAHDNPLLDERRPLIEFISKVRPGETVFKCTRRTFYNVVRRHARAAGLPAHLQHPHMLKHSIAMELYDKITVPELRIYLGHKSGASTLEYGKPSESAVCEAVRRAARN